MLLKPERLASLQQLIAEQQLDGWLLFDFKGRNPVATAVLGAEIIGTRRVFVKIPRTGVPTALIHEIDSELWRNWPCDWKKEVWVRREQLAALALKHFSKQRLAVDYSPSGDVPYLDCIPAGLVEFLRHAGTDLMPSIELVTRFLSAWTAEDRASHERAAKIIAEIAQVAMRLAGERARTRHPATEWDLACSIREAFDREGLLTDHGPSVSFGANSARNHYNPSPESAAKIVPGELLLVDLWAKEPGGIYADQTWMAAIGPSSERDAGLWDVVRRARDAALNLLRARVPNSIPIRGADVDQAAQAVIVESGFGSRIAGRTGHSIDRFGLHGFGPPIDNTETWDERLLIPGVGFSVEPGIYIPGETGVRSEVNALVGEREILITPEIFQAELLTV